VFHNSFRRKSAQVSNATGYQNTQDGRERFSMNGYLRKTNGFQKVIKHISTQMSISIWDIGFGIWDLRS
jgi:hypothetical protein